MFPLSFTLAGSSASTDVQPGGALVGWVNAMAVSVTSESPSEDYDEGFITGDELHTGFTTKAW